MRWVFVWALNLKMTTLANTQWRRRREKSIEVFLFSFIQKGQNIATVSGYVKLLCTKEGAVRQFLAKRKVAERNWQNEIIMCMHRYIWLVMPTQFNIQQCVRCECACDVQGVLIRLFFYLIFVAFIFISTFSCIHFLFLFATLPFCDATAYVNRCFSRSFYLAYITIINVCNKESHKQNIVCVHERESSSNTNKKLTEQINI